MSVNGDKQQDEPQQEERSWSHSAWFARPPRMVFQPSYFRPRFSSFYIDFNGARDREPDPDHLSRHEQHLKNRIERAHRHGNEEKAERLMHELEEYDRTHHHGMHQEQITGTQPREVYVSYNSPDAVIQDNPQPQFSSMPTAPVAQPHLSAREVATQQFILNIVAANRANDPETRREYLKQAMAEAHKCQDAPGGSFQSEYKFAVTAVTVIGADGKPYDLNFDRGFTDYAPDKVGGLIEDVSTKVAELGIGKSASHTEISNATKIITKVTPVVELEPTAHYNTIQHTPSHTNSPVNMPASQPAEKPLIQEYSTTHTPTEKESATRRFLENMERAANLPGGSSEQTEAIRAANKCFHECRNPDGSYSFAPIKISVVGNDKHMRNIGMPSNALRYEDVFSAQDAMEAAAKEINNAKVGTGITSTQIFDATVTVTKGVPGKESEHKKHQGYGAYAHYTNSLSFDGAGTELSQKDDEKELSRGYSASSMSKYVSEEDRKAFSPQNASMDDVNSKGGKFRSSSVVVAH